jgi:hypothetical protein
LKPIVALVLALGFSTSAYAVTHLGAEFTVDVVSYSGNTATFKYTADFSAGTWTGRDYITAIDFGLDGYKVVSSNLDSTTAAGTWSNTTGPSAAGTCKESTATFFCSDDPFAVPNQPTTGVVEWVVTVVFDSAIDPADFANTTNHIGAFFCDIDATGAANCGDGLSVGTAFGDGDGDGDVSEPATLLLLGAGLLGLALRRRRIA